MAEPSAQSRPSRRRVPRWVWFVVVCVALGVMTSVGVAWGIAWRQPQLRLLTKPMRWGTIEASRLPLEDEHGKPVVPHDAYWNVVEMKDTGVDVRDFRVLRGSFSMDDTYRSIFMQLASDRACRVAMARHTRLAHTRDADWVRFRTVSFGWPMRSLAYEDACTASETSAWKALLIDPSFIRNPRDPVSVLTPAPSPYSAWDVDPAFDLAPEYHAIHFKWRLLPTFPLWPGLLANTAIYGGAWVFLFGVSIAARRTFVRRRRVRQDHCPACGYSREGLKEGAPCPECGRTPIPATR